MTDAIIRGLADFEGETLGVFLAGLDCGDFPVIGAVITVPTDGSVADGYLTERWLNQVTAMKRDWGLNGAIVGKWKVPCIVGYRYKSRGQLVRPVAPGDTGSELGPGFGKFKRQHNFAAQVKSTGGISFGTSFDDGRMYPLGARNPGEIALSPTELASGIIVDSISDESSYDSMLAWEVEGPYSAMLCAVGGFITTEDK